MLKEWALQERLFWKGGNDNSFFQVAVTSEDPDCECVGALRGVVENRKRVGSWAWVAFITYVQGMNIWRLWSRKKMESLT